MEKEYQVNIENIVDKIKDVIQAEAEKITEEKYGNTISEKEKELVADNFYEELLNSVASKMEIESEVILRDKEDKIKGQIKTSK